MAVIVGLVACCQAVELSFLGCRAKMPQPIAAASRSQVVDPTGRSSPERAWDGTGRNRSRRTREGIKMDFRCRTCTHMKSHAGPQPTERANWAKQVGDWGSSAAAVAVRSRDPSHSSAHSSHRVSERAIQDRAPGKVVAGGVNNHAGPGLKSGPVSWPSCEGIDQSAKSSNASLYLRYSPLLGAPGRSSTSAKGKFSNCTGIAGDSQRTPHVCERAPSGFKDTLFWFPMNAEGRRDCSIVVCGWVWYDCRGDRRLHTYLLTDT